MVSTHAVRIGQIYQQLHRGDFQIVIHRKRGGHKWQTKVLTDRPGIYNGTHTMSEYTLRRRFKLITP